MADDSFDPTRIDGLFTDPVVLAEYELAIGIMHLTGTGLRVCIWDGADVRHMSAAAARRFAASLVDGPESLTMKPVWTALRETADRVDEIAERVVADRARAFDAMPVEGHA